LSDYKPLSDAGELPIQKHTTERIDKETGEIKETNLIHIFKPENIGDKMCIDDKCIGHKKNKNFFMFRVAKYFS